MKKLKALKICVHNKLCNSIHILDLYLYNKLRVDNLQKIINEIRHGVRDKSFIYVYGYKYSNKHGTCGVITDEKYTPKQFIKYSNYLKNKYKYLTIFTLNGENLV